MNLALEIIVGYFPPTLVDQLRSLKKTWRRTMYKAKQRINPVNTTRKNLVRAFHNVGLREGEGAIVYTAMSSFGHIEGGAQAVISAMEEVVGPHGLITMPAFPLVGNSIEYLKRQVVFDVRNTPSNMGTITESFRRMPNVKRSVHPTHSICAKGNGASWLIEGHEECATPFGPGSPFVKMIEKNMYLICFGVGVHVFTLYHTFEDLLGDNFPFRVYSNERFKVKCIKADGSEQIVSTPVHDPVLSKRRIDANPRKERQIRYLLQKSGALCSIAVGKGKIHAIKARDLMTELERFLRMGITIYV